MNKSNVKRNKTGLTGALTLCMSVLAAPAAMTTSSSVAGALLVGTVVSGPAFAKPNGKTTTVVQFSGGSFELNQRGEWQEFGNGSNNVRYTFRETHRDEWSVYGHDASRNMKIQLDMHRMMVSLEWPGHPMQDQYKITSASDRLNGRKASYVSMDGGSFTQQGSNWVERGTSGNIKYTFREVNRDMWSVYARDDSRNMDMQLDLHRNIISLAWPGQAKFDWKPIRDAR